MLFSVENENIIYNSFLSIAFTTPEDYQVLAPLCRRMAVSCRWRRSIKLLLPSCSSRLDHLSLSYVARRLDRSDIDFDHSPTKLHHLIALVRHISFFSLHARLTR